MEDNRNHNYDQEDRNYTDVPAAGFETSSKNDDPKPSYQENAEQFEEFTNQFDDDTTMGSMSNSDSIQENNGMNDDMPDPSIDGNESPYPAVYPDNDRQEGNTGYDDSSESESGIESDIDDEDLNEERDFAESDNDDFEEDIDDEDEMEGEKSELRL